jgi:hypothetical protein
VQGFVFRLLSGKQNNPENSAISASRAQRAVNMSLWKKFIEGRNDGVGKCRQPSFSLEYLNYPV